MDNHDLRASRYWRRNRLIVSLFLIIWASVTFGIAYYARELSSLDFLGWPFAYWVGAQGALLVYVLITVVFALVMNRMDLNFHRERQPGSREEGDR